MRLTELHIEGFGRIVNRRLRLTPGLNLVFGPNGSGKSTLLEAIAALLYGLQEDSQDPAVRARLQAFKPWQEAAFYAGSLTYSLDDGQGFRVLRRFLPRPEATLQTYPEGVDISGRFRPDRDAPPSFAQEFLGLDEAAFASLCLLRQGERGDLAAVRQSLLHILEAAPADPATARAIERLEAALAEYVGSPEDGEGPLDAALARCAALEEERERVLDARPGLLAQVAAQQQATLALQRAELMKEQLLLLQAQAARAGERARSAAMDETAAELARCEAEAARWQAWARFPAGVRDDLLRLSAQRSHLQMDCTIAERRAQQAQEGLRALSAQEEMLRNRIKEAGGAGPADGRTGAGEEGDVEALADEWSAATEAEATAEQRWQTARSALEALEQRLAQEGKPLEPILPLGTEGLATMQNRLHEARQQLARARSALSDATARWTRLGLDESQFQALESGRHADTLPPTPQEEHGGRQILTGVLRRLTRGGQSAPQSTGEAVYAEAQPLYANLLRCRIEVETAQQVMRDTEATTLWHLGDLLGGTLGDAAFAELQERLSKHLRALAELDQERISVTALQADLERARERSAKARRDLQAELARLGFDGSDLRKAIAGYRSRAGRPGRMAIEEAERERRRLRAETDLELLQLRKAALEGEVQVWQERQAALEDIEAQLDELLAQAGITEYSSFEAAFVTFEEGFRNHERWERAQASLETAIRCHRALLGAQAGADEDAARLLELDAQLQALGAEPPEWSTIAPDRPSAEYAPLLEAVEAQLAAAREECNRLQAAIEQSGNLRHPAEIAEEIEAARAEIQHMEHFRQAVLVARDELVTACREYRRHFAPQLGAAVCEGLSAVIPERCSGASVDPCTLALSLHIRGCDEEVPAAMLGAGGSDLAHLLLRLTVARLVAQAKEKVPLLLDEPLAHCDEERRRRALDHIAQQAEHTQILLFTADERLRARFREKWAGSALHQEIALE